MRQHTRHSQRSKPQLKNNYKCLNTLFRQNRNTPKENWDFHRINLQSKSPSYMHVTPDDTGTGKQRKNILLLAIADRL